VLSEVLTAMVIKNSIFWDITPCSPFNQRMFRKNKSLPFSGSKNKSRKRPARSRQQADYDCYLLLARFLLGLFFGPENGGDIFLRKLRCFSTDINALYPRRDLYSLYFFRLNMYQSTEHAAQIQNFS
jgi:hypothetical protein